MVKRNVHKRVDLSEKEADVLYAKAKLCNMSEAQYLRTCIMGSCPVEAPPKQFYLEMQNINKIGANINQIAHRANETHMVTLQDMTLLKEYYRELHEEIRKIKTIVLSARPYHATSWELYLAQVKEAKERKEPLPDLVKLLDTRGYIRNLNDPDLGRAYLGLQGSLDPDTK